MRPFLSGTIARLAETWAALASVRLFAATLYVSPESPNPSPPYADWTTAAHVIQDAVDLVAEGDEIVVTNGVYSTGGWAVEGNLLSRVAVTTPVVVRSVNGPAVTVIRGAKASGGGNGPGAIRCVYLAEGATLSGFTLTDGATLTGGDWNLDQCGGGAWCGPTNAVLTNCVLTGNSASEAGGGVFWGTLNNCTLTGNSASQGGGAHLGTLYNCTLTGNSASGVGGGASESTLYHSTLRGNSAHQGGGAAGGTLYRCALTGNSATLWGGGTWNSTLYGCSLTENSAGSGGGVSGGTLYNCTVTGNRARWGGGGIAGWCGWGCVPCTARNSVVYHNTAIVGGANYENPASSLFENSCTTPLPPAGDGNISLDPRLASASHLSAASPCIGAGSPTYATGADLDDEPWSNPPSIGCDEYWAGTVAGSLSVAWEAGETNVAVGHMVDFRGVIEGPTSASMWNFGDGVVVSNRPYASHAWVASGDYAVVLRAYNDTHPEGVSATGIVHVLEQPVHYVAADSSRPLAPYTSWPTAARTIQDAVDAATVPGALVLVSNGVYATGGRAVGTNVLVNRVAVEKPINLQSVNGPQVTLIRGANAVRCVYLASGASLSGFTLTNGGTRDVDDWWTNPQEVSGGGVLCESGSAVLTNCTLTGNSAQNGGGAYSGTLNHCELRGNTARNYGGGACGGTLDHCDLRGNTVGDRGGGAYGGTLDNCIFAGNRASCGGGAVEATLNHCTLVGNSATGDYGGGGVADCVLNNCIVYFNTAQQGPNYGVFNLQPIVLYSCTTPLPTNGVGNITSAPLFVNLDGGNLRLQSHSPCINAGNNAYVSGETDLDGRPRIVGGTVDMGAYEYQGPGVGEFIAWLQQYGLPTDGSADSADPDRDGLNTWQEWRCRTDPTDARSVLRLLSATPFGADVRVNWLGVEGVRYFLERSTNLGATPPFARLAANLVGVTGTNTFTDTNTAAPSGRFYRLSVGD